MHQKILVLITHGKLGTTETELTKWMLYKMMDAIHKGHPTPLTPPCAKSAFSLFMRFQMITFCEI